MQGCRLAAKRKISSVNIAVIFTKQVPKLNNRNCLRKPAVHNLLFNLSALAASFIFIFHYYVAIVIYLVHNKDCNKFKGLDIFYSPIDT